MFTNSNSSNVVWNMSYESVVQTHVHTTATSSSSNNITFSYIIKRCRDCKHAHAQENATGCYDVLGSSVTFVICKCKEHVPEDNLEYLEYLFKKKESLCEKLL